MVVVEFVGWEGDAQTPKAPRYVRPTKDNYFGLVVMPATCNIMPGIYIYKLSA